MITDTPPVTSHSKKGDKIDASLSNVLDTDLIGFEQVPEWQLYGNATLNQWF